MTRLRHITGRSLLAASALGYGVLVAFAGLPTSVAAQDATAPSTPAAVAAECVTDIGTTEVPDGALAYTIAGDESAARYRVQEELASVGVTEAVGETQAIAGMVLLDADGNPLPCSRFDVDLRTLVSDEARRDNYLYDNILETEEFPLATFILTDVDGVDAPLADGEETEVSLIGLLTVHGVTQAVEWDGTVTRGDDALTGSASVELDMADFEIEQPVVGPVISVEETFTLEIEIVADLAA